jgi:hypothetical protein
VFGAYRTVGTSALAVRFTAWVQEEILVNFRVKSGALTSSIVRMPPGKLITDVDAISKKSGMFVDFVGG